LGGFVLTNDFGEKTLKKIFTVFEKKRMNKHSIFELGKYRMIYFHKINLPEAGHIFADGDNRIIGIGTFAYGGQFGYSALESLYNDIISSQEIKSILNKVKGHFNLILHLNGELSIISDRTGSFHSFIGRDENHVYVSNFLFAVADNLSQLTIRKQEMMEFLMSGSMYGPKTLFDEVDYLEFGKVHLFLDKGEVTSTQYHVERVVEDGYSLDDHYHTIVKYLSFMRNVDFSISSELSAGFDSRQVCAILKHLGIEYTPNTNSNSWDTTDLLIAEEIAQGEGVNLSIYRKDLTRVNYEELLANSLSRTELCRDAFQAAYSYVFFDDKTKDFNMILGGFGGELYRDTKYHGINSISSLINYQYLDSRMMDVFSPEEIQQYKTGLAMKIKTLIGRSDSSLTKMDCEIIYYHMRMMYWGGSRITYFNSYGYRYHPLLDYELIYPLFHVGDDQKHDGKFQMQIIERFDRKMASYQSNYGYSFIWEKAKNHSSRPRFHTRVLRFLARNLRKIFSRGGIDTTTWKSEEDRTVWKKFVGGDLQIRKFFEKLHVREDEKYLGRIYTIETTLRRYESKISELR